jgi:hypothetical protein
MGKNESGVKWIVGLTGGLAAFASYFFVVRPWMLSWGASKDEVNRLLPGDELIPEPKLNATHAVDIQAPPAAIWPWLVQLGQGRGGFYSYEWIENSMGLDIHNANQILPEFQNLKTGDTIPLSPDGFGLPVAILEAPRTLVLHGDTRMPGPGKPLPMKPGEYLAVTWGFYLFEREKKVTRLVERWKADWSPGLANSIFYRLFLEPGAFIMERKMLLGIKQRVEATLSVS